jgi:minor extracellular serine protease Vpr
MPHLLISIITEFYFTFLEEIVRLRLILGGIMQSLLNSARFFTQFLSQQPALGLGVLLSALALSACSNKVSTIEKLGGEETAIFSNRPQNRTHFIAIVKLESAPLLSSARIENGVRVLNPDHVRQVNEEQATALESLKTISSEIRVLYRYKMVLNALAVVAPISAADRLQQAMNVVYVESEGQFARPAAVAAAAVAPGADLNAKNSVQFIGADKVHLLKAKGTNGEEVPMDGTGIRVGIIDTGIDFTHAMFGGAGTEEAFKAINPAQPSTGYPNAKVVGGIDLVGTEYNAASPRMDRKIPVPDENPIDEGGHGTHVAGTVAGIGDGTNTYSGVAPGATLYALKVFGKDGSTGDAAVIAALEFAVDPNLDGNLNDQLHVVNLSLGSGYGTKHMMYAEAIRHLVRGGTSVVASAGNSGSEKYIVGAPSVADEALSVAASVDFMDHNWKFGAISLGYPTGEREVTEAVEAATSKPLDEIQSLYGKLVDVGIGEALTDDQKAALKGNIALIARGKITFSDKIKNAQEAGAVAVIVTNNQDGAAFGMGGDGKFEIPAVMITKALGVKARAQMATGDVFSDFKAPEKIEKPQLIDTITGFSSRGPRSLDALMKPEISAPGEMVISAAMGGGVKSVKMSGTSMAAPHMAGVMALMHQARPDLTALDLKSMAMGTSKQINNDEGKLYPLSHQGAGRVQADQAVATPLVLDRPSLSLGELSLQRAAQYRDVFHVKNVSTQTVTAKLSLNSVSAGLSIALAQDTLVLAAGETKALPVRLLVSVEALKDAVTELNALISLTVDGKEIQKLPVLAIVQKAALVKTTALSVAAATEEDSVGVEATLSLQNRSVNKGQALIFNLLATDERKPANRPGETSASRACDLEAVGYRVIDKAVEGGGSKRVLQIGAKMYDTLTSWTLCELTALVDTNGDGIAEQELAAVQLGSVAGLAPANLANQFGSVLLDAGKAREIRKTFEAQSLIDESKAKEEYVEAALDMSPLEVYNNSSVITLEADVTKLATNSIGELHLQVASISTEARSVEMDDILGDRSSWKKLSLKPMDHAFLGMPEKVELDGSAAQSVTLTKGMGTESVLVLYPLNFKVQSDFHRNQQSEVVAPKFQIP